MSGPPTTAVFLTRDDEGNLLETQYGRSVFRDQQVRCERRHSEAWDREAINLTVLPVVSTPVTLAKGQ